jgi:mono/diheme cytochrome c family protein
MSPAAFDKWLKSQSQPASAAGSGASATVDGKTVFADNACASCHTLKAAGASGKVGPDLDQLPAEAKRAGKPVADFVRQSITDPSAYVEPGFPDNVMPKTFASSLSKPQLDALVSYLVDSSK